VACLFKGYLFSRKPHDKSWLSFQPLSTFEILGFLKNNFVVNDDGMGWGWDGVGWLVCEGWLVFAKATCFPENHLTNHCCLSSRYLLLTILAFLKNNFVVNADGVGWGWDGVGRV